VYIPQAPAGNEGGDERWLISYADMITLLTVVFIILFSMSNIELEKFKALSESMTDGFGATKKSTSLDPNPDGLGEDPSTTPIDFNTISGGQSPGILFPEFQTPIQVFRFRRIMEGTDGEKGLLDKLRDLLEEESRRQGAALASEFEHDERVSMHFTERGIVLTFKDDQLLFDSGAAELRPVFRQLLQRLNLELGKLPNSIEVLGHTDNIPIASSRFPSNWELSAARAASVARFLVSDGLPSDKVSVAGYADTRPLEPNVSAHGRAVNRRVEIVILRGYGEAPMDEQMQSAASPEVVLPPSPGLPVGPAAGPGGSH
jgi:chemotaxis protein MotB